MFAAGEFKDEAEHYKGKLGKKVGKANMILSKTRDWTAGMSVFDNANPAEPRQIGIMDVEDGGIHCLLYVGGRWASASVPLVSTGSLITSLSTPTWRIRPTPRKPARRAAGNERHGGRRTVRR